MEQIVKAKVSGLLRSEAADSTNHCGAKQGARPPTWPPLFHLQVSRSLLNGRRRQFVYDPWLHLGCIGDTVERAQLARVERRLATTNLNDLP